LTMRVAVSPAGLAAAGVVARGSAAARIRLNAAAVAARPVRAANTSRTTSPANVESSSARGDVAGPRAAFLSPFAPPAVTDDEGGVSATKEKTKTTKRLRLRIDEQWYDCTGWAKAHPGGSLFITLMDGCDATDVFYALHSYGPNGDDTAARRLAMLPKCGGPEDDFENFEDGSTTFEFKGDGKAHSPKTAPHTFELNPSTPGGGADLKFAALRKKFEQGGWFARDPWKEAAVLATTVGLYALGWFLAKSHPILATLSLGLGMQQAGWLAHDYIHGRGKWCGVMRNFGALANGFSAEWWQNKHNMHHSFTNIDGRDGDIKLEPLYFLQDPAVTNRADNPAMRKWQHWCVGFPLEIDTVPVLLPG
jgi:hypothetical protein